MDRSHIDWYIEKGSLTKQVNVKKLSLLFTFKLLRIIFMKSISARKGSVSAEGFSAGKENSLLLLIINTEKIRWQILHEAKHEVMPDKRATLLLFMKYIGHKDGYSDNI